MHPTKHPQLENDGPVASPIIAGAKPLSVPPDMRDPGHPGHKAYGAALKEVHAMEASRGIPSGPHSENLAAGMAVAAEYAKVSIARVELRGDQVVAVSRPRGVDEPATTAAVAVDFATTRSVGEHSAAWLKARSPHFGEGAIVERSAEQVRLLNQLSGKDQAMFAKLRENLPPQINDDKVAQATLQARRAGIDSPEKLALVAVSGDHVLMRSQAGRNETVSLSQPAPPLHETVSQTHALNQQQIQQQLTRQQLNQQQVNQQRPNQQQPNQQQSNQQSPNQQLFGRQPFFPNGPRGPFTG